MKNNRAWKLSMASLIMGIIHFAVNLPWAAAILLWGDADVHGGLGLFENSRIMDLLASLSFFLGILFVWVVFAVLSVVFGCLVLRKEPDKNTAHGCGRHSAESSGICRPRCLYECLGAIRRGLKTCVKGGGDHRPAGHSDPADSLGNQK